MKARHVAIPLALCLLLGGCSQSNAIKRADGSPKENVDERFLCDKDYYEFETVTDTKEGVVYLIWKDGDTKGSHGGITVLVHKDGTPVTSEEVADE